jgi:hypothetical protein
LTLPGRIRLVEHDEDAHKGTAVTKPIDLRAKKAGSSIRGREKTHSGNPDEAAKGARAAPVHTIAARKTASKPEIVEQIGLRLRGCYNDVLMQPIPERFIDLLGQLEAGVPAGPQQEPGNIASKKDVK